MTHRHDPELFVWQLITARLSLDWQATLDLADDVGDCVQCWMSIAVLLSVEAVGGLLYALGPVYIDHRAGRTFGPAVDFARDMYELTRVTPEELGSVA